jgi:hypothetical protein
MGIRVVHWGVGQTGRLALQGVIGHPDLDLVGVCVQRPENAGRDAGDLCDRPKTGIIATRSIEEALALKPDCVSYFGSGMADAEGGVETVARFLEAGVNVVTTSLASLIHPEHAPAPLRERVEGPAGRAAPASSPPASSRATPATSCLWSCSRRPTASTRCG